MLTFPIYEAVSFITATFHLVVKQRVAKGGSGIHLCLKEMVNELFNFCVALFFLGQFKISVVPRGHKVIFAIQERPCSLPLIRIYYLNTQCS